MFDHLPQQRRLTDSEKSKARELLSLQANKSLFNKIVTFRVLSNIAKDVKSSSNNLEEAVSLLQGKYRKSNFIKFISVHSKTSEQENV